MADLRNHPRIQTDRPILITLSDGQHIQARLNTISCGGLGVLYSAPAEIKAKLLVEFKLIYRDKSVSIQEQTTVRFCHIKEDAFLSGLEFINLSKINTKIIQSFVEQRLADASNNIGINVDYSSNKINT